MAGAQQVSVGTTPALLVSAPAGILPGPVGWFSLNNGTGATVYLNGGTTVSSSNGYPLGTSPTTQTPNALAGYVWAGDNIYGVTASGTSTVDVLVMGV